MWLTGAAELQDQRVWIRTVPGVRGERRGGGGFLSHVGCVSDAVTMATPLLHLNSVLNLLHLRFIVFCFSSFWSSREAFCCSVVCFPAQPDSKRNIKAQPSCHTGRADCCFYSEIPAQELREFVCFYQPTSVVEEFKYLWWICETDPVQAVLPHREHKQEVTETFELCVSGCAQRIHTTTAPRTPALCGRRLSDTMSCIRLWGSAWRWRWSARTSGNLWPSPAMVRTCWGSVRTAERGAPFGFRLHWICILALKHVFISSH